MTMVPASPSLLVVGSTMMDMVAYVDRMPDDGETLYGRSFALGFGGKGANQAVMARRLGAAVAMVNRVGDDVFGEMTLANFDREGIDRSAVLPVADTSTGAAPIWVDSSGMNRIVIVPGANHRLTAAEAATAVERAEHVDLVIGQFEIPAEVTRAAFTAARQRGALTVLNPAPAAPVTAELLAVTDYLIPNEHEFAVMAEDLGIDAVGPDGLPRPDGLAAAATRWGVTVVVTLGSAGAMLAQPGARVVTVPAPRVDAVDTTGAGDAFVGAFGYGLGLGWDPAAAVRLGIACASDTVLREGTQASYPTPERAQGICARVAAQ